MKIKVFFLMSALIPSISQSMHIKNSSTIVQFNGQKKSINEWIRDDRKKAFGKTAVIFTTTNQSPFTKISSIKTLHPDNFQLITMGYAFYCSNIKKKKEIEYGAIVINPEQHHFDTAIANKICRNLRDAYVEKKLATKNTLAVNLDSDEMSQ